jgi:hypothetical protein
MLPRSNLDKMIETISCFDATLAPRVHLMGSVRTDRLTWNPCWDGLCCDENDDNYEVLVKLITR